MSDRLPVVARSTSYACPNDCGNGVSRSDKHPTWHCWRCHVDAVEVEYVTLRAADYEGAVDALRDAWGYLAHDEQDAAQVVIERACEVLGVDPPTPKT